MEVVIDNVRFVAVLPCDDGLIPFNKMIRDARKLKRESLEGAALGMDISRSQLWAYEKGSLEPGLRNLKKIIAYYGLDFNQIA